MYIKELKVPQPSGAQTKKFPFNIGIFANGLDFKFKKAVTIFAGENASGKSTLLESLAVKCGFPRQGGFRGQNVIRKSYGMSANPYDGELHEVNYDNLELGEIMQVQWYTRPKFGYFFRSEYMSETMQMHGFLAKRLLSSSHGEGILEMISSNFKDGLFILDEPESALSPTSLLALVSLIHEKVKRFNTQYIIVTHSPIIMAIPDSDFFWIGGGEIKSMDYKESPHFQISKVFFSNPERLIAQAVQKDAGEE